MHRRLEGIRAEFRSTLDADQQRGVKVLGWVAACVLLGVTITGIWQFFAHESDPAWFDHVVGTTSRGPTSPSSGIAELHGMFSTVAGVVALLGGAWFAYKVIFDVPWIAVATVAVVVFGSVTGSTIRFNAIKLVDRPYGDADAGYLQLFGGDVEYVVTDKWDLGPLAIQLLTLAHVFALPVLVAIAWFTLPSATTDGRSDL